MSGLLAVFGPALDEADPSVGAAWERVRRFGGEDAELRSGAGAIVGVARHPWQRAVDLAGTTMVLEEGGVVVAADASLYDRAGLARRLAAAGEEPRGPDPAHWILAAYRAWGAGLVEVLVGDYAFVLHDPAARRIVAARDPLGSRPLFHARRGEALGLASSSLALARWRGTEGELDLACVGGLVAGTLLSMGTDSVHAGVAALRPGFLLVDEPGVRRIKRFWHPPAAPDPAAPPLAEAAEAFRELLLQVVDERMGEGAATVWMSGGWDSTAVFGAGQAALERNPDPRRRLEPVSIRYPEGDPGHEDPWIEATAARWDAPVEWLASEEIPLLDDLVERAGAADEPPPHLYERWNVALARGSRRRGARIALDGSGGDNLFQVSDVVMADHLRRGHPARAWRLARARRGLGWRYLVRHALVPLAPPSLLRGLERATGRNVPRHHMELPRAPWVPDDFVRRHRLRERDLAILDEVAVTGRAQSENRAYVTVPALAWGGSYMRGVLLREGVEVRSPLLDPRVVDFALRRPVSDRAGGSETKRLLRAAVAGWVPAEVLAPRAKRTGVASGFSARRMREDYPGLLERLFAEPLRLADLGVVDPRALREGAEAWRSGREEGLRTALFNAMRVEFWLRGTRDG